MAKNLSDPLLDHCKGSVAGAELQPGFLLVHRATMCCDILRSAVPLHSGVSGAGRLERSHKTGEFIAKYAVTRSGFFSNLCAGACNEVQRQNALILRDPFGRLLLYMQLFSKPCDMGRLCPGQLIVEVTPQVCFGFCGSFLT